MRYLDAFLAEVDKATDLDLRLEHAVRESILLAEQVASLVITDELDAAKALADRWDELRAECKALEWRRQAVGKEMNMILSDSQESGMA